MKGIVRPPMNIADDSALIQDGFSHVVITELPYWIEPGGTFEKPLGTLTVGSKVSLLRYDGGAFCYVKDERGLFVATVFSGLRQQVSDQANR
jgi:hypothetical protein